uniref:DUF4861 family protein n=1 Tax=Alistipes sp. TaxID=1872444 RepID=UPI004056DFDC
MKKIFAMAALSLLAACSAPKLRVEVTNPTETPRSFETVEVEWEQIAAKGISADEIVVESNGVQIPSQVLYNGGTEPVALIFQCSVEANATNTYTLRAGEREAYAPKAYGRFVPERLDDYAWENDKIAFRAYGPALESAPGEMLATPGYDCWVKCVDTLVVDARYKRGDYHHNYGDGMDCYKVGRTLGAGASAPLFEEKLCLSRNYVTYETLENGPIRTSVKLTYAPFAVGDKEVALTKIITLDAHSHFNRMENIYTGDFDTLPIAAGFIRHKVKGLSTGEGWLAFSEEASDSKQPEVDGDLYFAVILPGGEMRAELDGHAVAVANTKSGESLLYYAGAGWSHGGVADMPYWMTLTEQTAAALSAPLQVEVK